MKTLSPWLSAILILSLALAILFPGIYGDEQIAARLIEIDKYGFVYVVDTVPRTGDSTDIGFPRHLLTNLVDYYSPDGEVELVVEREYFWLRVHASAGANITLKTIFGDVIRRGMEDTFTLNFPLNPLTREDLGRIYARVILPRGCDVREASPEFLEVRKDGREALGSGEVDTTTFNPLTVTYGMGDMRLLKPTTVELNLDLASGEAEYRVRFSLRGGRDLDGIGFTLPPGSELIETRDQLRRISRSYEEESGRLHVTFGQSLELGEAQTVIIRFKPPEGSIYELEDGVLTVHPLLPMNLSTPFYRLTVTVAAAEYLGSEPQPAELIRLYPERLRLAYNLGILSPLTAEERSIRVELKPVASRFAALPYLWGLALAVLVVGAVLSVSKLRITARVAEEEKKLGELVEEAEGVFAACQRIADLIATKRILDKGYIRPRLLELRSSVRRHGGRVAHLSAELRKLLPELSGPISSAAEASREIERDVESLWSRTHRYLTGSMGRSAFSKQAEEHYKRIREHHRRLSDALEKLRQKLP